MSITSVQMRGQNDLSTMQNNCFTKLSCCFSQVVYCKDEFCWKKSTCNVFFGGMLDKLAIGWSNLIAAFSLFDVHSLSLLALHSLFLSYCKQWLDQCYQTEYSGTYVAAQQWQCHCSLVSLASCLSIELMYDWEM